MKSDHRSIFERYYSDEPFIDRYAENPAGAVDVIIPVMHTNELWRANLKSFYREIPINRLLIGDGGCIDDSIEVVKEFPRVVVFDHTGYVSLGYSIRKLIEVVETEWFLYLHSDVYLPPGWFEAMQRHQSEYDWFGCPMHLTVLVEYPRRLKDRPYMGSQMGRKAAFLPGLNKIDDDYIYRQEEFVFNRLVEEAGFKTGKIEDTFHYHQAMHKVSKWDRKVTAVAISVESSPKEDLRSSRSQVRGTIKYLQPTPYHIDSVRKNLSRLKELEDLDWSEFKNWVAEVNPDWLRYIRRPTRWHSMAEKVKRGLKYLFS